MNRMSRCLALAIVALPLALTGAFADEAEVYNLVMNKDGFTPDRIEIPADKKVLLAIDNQDDGAEKLNFMVTREKVLSGASKTRVFIGPLEPGEYKFVGIYHPNRAFVVIAR